MGIYIHDWGSHESDFHNVTQYGSKMCHRNNTHQQPSKRQQKCGHGPQMVRTKPQVGTKPQIGEDRTSDRDETLGCGDGTHAATRRWKWSVPMMVDGSTDGEGGRPDVP